MKTYIYLGDKLTVPELKNKICTAVLRPNGKCIRSKKGTMLVQFGKTKHIVIARLLRKVKTITDLIWKEIK